MTRRADTAPRPTVGAELERMRLEHRARRLERALRRLRDRATVADAGVTRRARLDRAVTDVSGELDRVRDRLADAPGAAPARLGDRSAIR